MLNIIDQRHNFVNICVPCRIFYAVINDVSMASVLAWKDEKDSDDFYYTLL